MVRGATPSVRANCRKRRFPLFHERSVNRPFYPCQTPDGTTFVVDERTGNVVKTIASNPDTVQRWKIAKALAIALNREAAVERATMIGRVRLGLLILAFVALCLVLRRLIP